jgi:hypothetical protein
VTWRPWLESAAVALLAIGGWLLGRWFSRLPKSYWLLGYFLPLLLLLAYGAAMRFPALAFVPPISWLVMGRNKFAVIGFITTMVLTAPLSRLPQLRSRVAVCVLMAVVVSVMSVWPFLAPAFNRKHLAGLTTRFDANGICLQSNDYNCGPAAAVTALRKLGLAAEEGEIAIVAHTSSATGTPPGVLARALQDHYAADGLATRYRVFRGVEELKHGGLTLAVIKYGFWVDHYVTVLEVTDDHVVVGDPSRGLCTFTHQEFLAKWRFVGVVLHRN